MAGLVYAYYHFTLLKYYAITLDSGKNLLVLSNKPSKAAAAEFIDELYERRKTYYRSQYFFIDYENDRKKELGKMQWLRSEDIITENEYNVVVDEINENIDL